MLKLSILAVDDSPVITEMIGDAFKDEGYKVLTAQDGSEALKIALEENPDIIIADIAMPGMDGWELCSQIRSHPFTSFIPFIFLTSRAEAPDRIRGLQLGADDYLTKPFEMAELIARVKLIFQRILKAQEGMLIRESKGLSGSTDEMALPDLLQLFGINQKTGLLRVNKMGLPPGYIALSQGKIIRAETGGARGEKALYRLLAWTNARFDVQPLMGEEEDAGFPMSVDEALMEGMRQMDEQAVVLKEYSLEGKTLAVENEPSESELSPREAEFLAAVEREGAFPAVLDELPWTDYEICRMAGYFIRKGIVSIQ